MSFGNGSFSGDIPEFFGGGTKSSSTLPEICSHFAFQKQVQIAPIHLWFFVKAFAASFREGTGRIIPLSKLLVTLIYKPFRPFGRGTIPYLGDLLNMVINHLQVMRWSSKYSPAINFITQVLTQQSRAFSQAFHNGFQATSRYSRYPESQPQFGLPPFLGEK